ncbi:MAG: hypothetical protein JSR45_02215 [Proteobacteria bacterium]|nr:hypothetical protein [Pseudomonadota bacterium]
MHPLDVTILKHGWTPTVFFFFGAILAVLFLFSGLGVRARTPAIRLVFRALAAVTGAGAVICLIGWAWKSLT